jgi:signal recognition particle subunit SRP54
MGDVMTLIEKAQDAFDEEEARKLQKKLMQNQFTLQDFLEQMQKVKKLGSITQLMGMVPGLNKLKDQIDPEEANKRMKRVEAIISSMTIHERNNPKVLDASRKKRIARGSGVEVRDVNDLLKQFADMQRLMGEMRKGRFKMPPNLPGGFMR